MKTMKELKTKTQLNAFGEVLKDALDYNRVPSGNRDQATDYAMVDSLVSAAKRLPEVEAAEREQRKAANFWIKEHGRMEAQRDALARVIKGASRQNQDEFPLDGCCLSIANRLYKEATQILGADWKDPLKSEMSELKIQVHEGCEDLGLNDCFEVMAGPHGIASFESRENAEEYIRLKSALTAARQRVEDAKEMLKYGYGQQEKIDFAIKILEGETDLPKPRKTLKEQPKENGNG